MVGYVDKRKKKFGVFLSRIGIYWGIMLYFSYFFEYVL